MAQHQFLGVGFAVVEIEGSLVFVLLVYQTSVALADNLRSVAFGLQANPHHLRE